MHFPQGITFLNTLLSVGLFLGFTLFVFLLVRPSQRSHSNIFLAFLVLCYALSLLPGYLYGARLLERFPHIANSFRYLFPLLGPLIYFYCKSSTQQSFTLKKTDALHLIPFVLFLFIAFSNYDPTPSVVVAKYVELLKTGKMNVPVWERISKVVHAFAYFIISVRLILLYKKHLVTTSTYVEEIYYQWLLFFSSILLLPFFILVTFIFTQYQFISVSIFASSFVFFIVMVYFAILYKPALFQQFPNQLMSSEERENEKRKYGNSNLQEAQKERMVTRLLAYVEEHKPYLESELTLGMLSEQLNIPSHYLSQIINEKIQQSFGDFINSYRVETAKMLLTDEKYSDYTILATAYEAGFNSKSAFYAAFRKFTDATPSQYRKEFLTS